MAAVTISEAVKRFGANAVIHGVSVQIDDGAFVVLVGPSGCGKSTLLRMIAGLEPISGGEIAIDGAVVNDLPPAARDVAMVFQNYALYPHMTVFDNIAFSLRMRKTAKAEVRKRVERAAATLGLGPFLARYPRQLSGGQRQRVAMGRAIVRQPRVFLFDEPLSNLDAQLRVQMRGEIKLLHQTLRATTVYVTHDQIEAMTMADKIVVMRGGRIEQSGRPLEIYDRPANTFVAGFIGSPAMNLIEGDITSADGRPRLQAGGAMLPLPGRPRGKRDGDRVVLGLRPEHFSAANEGEDDAVAGTLAVVEPTGSEVLAVLQVGETAINALFRERVTLRAGDAMRLCPDLSRALLFDPADGGRRLDLAH